MAKRNPESAVQKQCMEYLRMKRIFHWRNNNHGTARTRKDGSTFWTFHGTKGVSDIIGIMPDGKMLAVEVKAGKNDLSDSQKEFQENIRRCGGHAIAVWDVQELIDYLDKH